MLTKLTVRNYALIRELDVEPGEGLTIITGETGAGKSIILGALSLILGNRADTSALLNKNDKCVVEGCFRISALNMQEFFSKHDLDYDDDTTIRREISSSGKSRAFINDTPVTLNILREAGDRLVDIHSQHTNLLLNDNRFQLGVVDAVAGTAPLIDRYSSLYSSYSSTKKEYDALRANAERNSADLEYYMFQLDQLEKADLKDGETTGLEREREMLANAEEIRSALSASIRCLREDELSAENLLSEVRGHLRKTEPYLIKGEELISRFESVIIEINDITTEISELLSTVEADPGRLQIVSDRLDHLWSLQQKHRAASDTELIERREELRTIVNGIETGDERLKQLELSIEKDRTELISMAGEISDMRSSSLPDLHKRVEELLRSLGIPNARFMVRLTNTADLTANGTDRAAFLFSANKQTPPELLSSIASGGELSRVMLSLKHILCQTEKLPSVIFDEIDAGVSGEVAAMVGEMLSEMGRHMQVINITHLPQIAAKGDRHYFVYKNDTADSTFTHLKLLNEDERVGEIARLLSGSEISDAAVENARLLLGNGKIP
jgi:DNA repair protein RecN (Recombination protein N)